MAKLIKVSGENFAGFCSFKLYLKDQGLVFISGENLDTDSASSNGSCKSGLLKSIGWCLYGKSVDNEYGDKVIRRGEKCARVTMVIDDEGNKYKVIRERRKQSPGLFIIKDGESLKLSKNDLQRQIDQLIGINWDGFRNTVLYGQMDRDRFIYPTTKDIDRKDILQKILGTGIFSACFSEVKSKRLESDKKSALLSSEYDYLKSSIQGFNLQYLKEKAANYESEKNESVKALMNEAKDLARKAKISFSCDRKEICLRIEDLESKCAECRHNIIESKQEVVIVRKQLEAMGRKLAEARLEIKFLNSQIEKLDVNSCPTCGQNIEPLFKSRRVKGLRKEIDLKNSVVYGFVSEIEKLNKQIEETSYKRIQFEEDLSSMISEQGDLRAKISAVDLEKKRTDELVSIAKQRVSEANKMKSSINPYEEQLKEVKTKIRDLKQRAIEKKKELSQLKNEQSALEFWVKGFGPTGIPSFALDSVMPYLTERANHYLEILSDGDMSINFTTQRELKSSSGEFRDQIGIFWSIEGIDGYPPSGGQWKKMEISTNFALMDLVSTKKGSHIDILCLDECLDGLDVEGRQRVVSVLRDLRKRRSSIFVISHDTDLAESFDKLIVVVKEDGVSRIEEK